MKRALPGFAVLVLLTATARAQLLPPSHYLAFDHPDAGAALSPFRDMSFRYFHLETFEDGFLNTPGVTPFLMGSVAGPGGNTDSVDEDDGAIDGSGTNARSYFRSGNATTGASVAFVFESATLGGLPTHVGIVWTDGSGTITFTAYDSNGGSLGSSVGPTPGVFGSHNGQTDEDTFFGVIHQGGISRIDVHNVLPGFQTGIEVDHLQYGAPVPEPQTYALLLAGLGLLGFAARRKTRRR